GGGARRARRVDTAVRRLAARPHAPVYRVSAEPACQRQAAGLHRLDRGTDGAACARDGRTAAAPGRQPARRTGRRAARYHWGVMPRRLIISLTRWFSAASTFLASWRDAG